MNLLILAAGTGSRLGGIGKKLPKVLISHNGKTNLERILFNFSQINISRTTIVVGYKRYLFDKLGHDFQLVSNESFESTNMLYSLKIALEKIEFDQDLFISYGDIVFTNKIIKKMSENKMDLVIASDHNWKNNWAKRFDNVLSDLENFKSHPLDKLLLMIGGKANNLNDIDGQYMGILLFRKGILERIKYLLNPAILKELGLDLANASMTDFLNILIHKGLKIGIEENFDPWIEIDSAKDYTLYSEIVDKIDHLNFSAT